MTLDQDNVGTHRALQVASRAAREGGTVAKARLRDPGYLKWKGNRDVVSEATLQVQEHIVSVILEEFPGAGILAEEGPADAPLPVDAEDLWIIDPICGSQNFVRGIPHFGVSIAWRSKGRIRAAAVYNPCGDELFEASTMTQTTLNGGKCIVQQAFEGDDAWNNAVIGTDWPYDGPTRRRATQILALMVDKVSQCTLMGSPALGLCNVAAGRLHGYWHLDLKIWDIAAPSLIVERAGGILADTQGMSWLFSDGGYIASNTSIHNRLIESIRVCSDSLYDANGRDGANP